ncbi:calmodulin-binding protein 60 D-like isoform X1 [Panicum virgatum]|nr:calmodulin-binding protein 60 D-like isoform X1 [Panicum virgatum]XP_039843873.1 calmodulin-binding protein 60 D-like isoform X1 [Panicum virgatum]
MFEGGSKITSGPLSKVKVEVLVLRGEFCNNERDDWTEEEFDNHILQGRDEQGLLGTVQLTKGEAELSQIRFKKGTCRKKVIMAARVCKGENIALRVQGAIMKPVVVQDRRNEANEKRHPPSLDDDVFRLEEIARNGEYRKRLKKEGICTVQDFLKALNKDPNKLRKILKMENQNSSWLKLTGHARQCVLEDMPELKRYQSEEGNVVLFFNCVHDLIGAEFGCHYVASGNFSPDQKALVNKWKWRAYDKLEDIASDYIIKDNVPERISASPDAAAGPSVPVFSAPQPNFTASQGTEAAENSPHGDINHIIPHQNGHSDAMIIHPGYLNTNDYQAQRTALPAQQLITPESILPSCQQNDATQMDPCCTFESVLQCIDGLQVAMPDAGACFCFDIALQPLCPVHGQGHSCSELPGSGHSNDYPYQ